MRYRSVAIIGPSTVGKTSVAFGLARKIEGEIVNLDKIYTYRTLPISSGLSDALEMEGIEKHLYAFLDLEEEPVPAPIYAEMVREKCMSIVSKGRTPIAEGGSTTYFPAFYACNEERPFCNLIIGLTPPPYDSLRHNIKSRISDAIDRGLLTEVKANAMRKSNLLSDMHVTAPLIEHLAGKIGIEEAKERILERALAYTNLQMSIFAKYDRITWLEYNPSHQQTIECIIGLMRTGAKF
jgi:tRNA A37 N6-isopentenylltransferase MiaA